MASAYLPALLRIIIYSMNAIMLVVVSHMAGPYRPTPEKGMPYESGMIPLGDSRQRFSVQFYGVGILFIVFDIEAVSLIPRAVDFGELGVAGSLEGVLFMVTLGAALLYACNKGCPEMGLSGADRWRGRFHAGNALTGAADADEDTRVRETVGIGEAPAGIRRWRDDWVSVGESAGPNRPFKEAPMKPTDEVGEGRLTRKRVGSWMLGAGAGGLGGLSGESVLDSFGDALAQLGGSMDNPEHLQCRRHVGRQGGDPAHASGHGYAAPAFTAVLMSRSTAVTMCDVRWLRPAEPDLP